MSNSLSHSIRFLRDENVKRRLEIFLKEQEFETAKYYTLEAVNFEIALIQTSLLLIIKPKYL